MLARVSMGFNLWAVPDAPSPSPSPGAGQVEMTAQQPASWEQYLRGGRVPKALLNDRGVLFVHPVLDPADGKTYESRGAHDRRPINRNIKQAAEAFRAGDDWWSNAVCPITQEFMQRAAQAADGFSYDREDIAAHLAQSGRSPLTNQDLAHRRLVDNHALTALAHALQLAQESYYPDEDQLLAQAFVAVPAPGAPTAPPATVFGATASSPAAPPHRAPVAGALYDIPYDAWAAAPGVPGHGHQAVGAAGHGQPLLAGRTLVRAGLLAVVAEGLVVGAAGIVRQLQVNRIAGFFPHDCGAFDACTIGYTATTEASQQAYFSALMQQNMTWTAQVRRVAASLTDAAAQACLQGLMGCQGQESQRFAAYTADVAAQERAAQQRFQDISVYGLAVCGALAVGSLGVLAVRRWAARP